MWMCTLVQFVHLLEAGCTLGHVYLESNSLARSCPSYTSKEVGLSYAKCEISGFYNVYEGLHEWWTVQDRLRLQLPGQLCGASPWRHSGGSWPTQTQRGQDHRQLDHPIKTWVLWPTDFDTLNNFWSRCEAQFVFQSPEWARSSGCWSCTRWWWRAWGSSSPSPGPASMSMSSASPSCRSWDSRGEGNHVNIDMIWLTQEKIMKIGKWLWSPGDCDYDGENPIRHSVISFLLCWPVGPGLTLITISTMEIILTLSSFPFNSI